MSESPCIDGFSSGSHSYTQQRGSNRRIAETNEKDVLGETVCVVTYRFTGLAEEQFEQIAQDLSPFSQFVHVPVAMKRTSEGV